MRGNNCVSPMRARCAGGPHSAFTSEWLHSYAWLASAGWAVLLVNYRGTTGCGEAMTASLPGNIGTNDVEDVYAATLTALKLGGASSSNASASGAASVPPALAAAIEGVDTLHQQPLNLGTVTIMSDTLDGADAVAAAAPAAAAVAGGGGPSSSPTGSARQRQARTSGTRAACFDARNVVIIGGSHGGFLAGHAVGAHAELYRAAALRNPVINGACVRGRACLAVMRIFLSRAGDTVVERLLRMIILAAVTPCYDYIAFIRYVRCSCGSDSTANYQQYICGPPLVLRAVASMVSTTDIPDW